MITIYKYPIVADDYFTVDLPQNAEILCIQTQSGNPFMWAKVDTEQPKEKRHFRVFGTGHEMSADDAYNTKMYKGTF